MKILEIVQVYLEPHWTQKNIDDAARGMAIGECNDDEGMVLKSHLEIHRDSYKNGRLSLATYSSLVIAELRLASRGT